MTAPELTVRDAEEAGRLRPPVKERVPGPDLVKERLKGAAAGEVRVSEPAMSKWVCSVKRTGAVMEWWPLRT